MLMMICPAQVGALLLNRMNDKHQLEVSVQNILVLECLVVLHAYCNPGQNRQPIFTCSFVVHEFGHHLITTNNISSHIFGFCS